MKNKNLSLSEETKGQKKGQLGKGRKRKNVTTTCKMEMWETGEK